MLGWQILGGPLLMSLPTPPNWVNRTRERKPFSGDAHASTILGCSLLVLTISVQWPPLGVTQAVWRGDACSQRAPGRGTSLEKWGYCSHLLQGNILRHWKMLSCSWKRTSWSILMPHAAWTASHQTLGANKMALLHCLLPKSHTQSHFWGEKNCKCSSLNRLLSTSIHDDVESMLQHLWCD